MAAPLFEHEEARLAALHQYYILDTPAEESYDDITRLAAFICSTPISTVTFIDAKRQWFKSVLGLDTQETPRDLAFCAHTILQRDLMFVPDATKDVRFADNPLVTGDPHIRFYAGMPLVTENGHALGSLCVIDYVPRHLTPEQEAALHTLARQVTNNLDMARHGALQNQLIAEREVAEEALRASELRYRRLFETARDGILILDGETGKITNANLFMVELLGYTQDEFLGKQLWEIGLLWDKETSQQAFQQLQQDGYIRYEDLPLVARLGGRREVEVVSNLYRENGHMVIQCNIRDITKRKEAEKGLRQSEARLRLALESGRLGSYDMDQVTGQFLEVSDIYKAQFGLPPDAEFSLRTLIKMVHPDDLARMTAVVARANQERHGFQEEHRVVWPDGSVHWISTHATPTYDESGQPARLIGIHQDITERKHAQEAARQSEIRLAEAQRIAHVGSWELDMATGERTWSEEMYRICGLDSAQGPPDEATQRACYYPDDLPRHDEALTEMVITGQPTEMDARTVRPDGEIRWCHLTARTILDADGQVVRVVGTAADITERMEREQQVRDTNLVLEVQKAQLEAANIELQALATTDPLTGLFNYRAFQARLMEEAACAERVGFRAAVALLDMDNFRFLNDAYGHAIGDDVLRQVAARLKEVCGMEDTVARFGGDEFTVLLPDVALTTTPAEVEMRLQAGLDGLSYQPPGEAAAIPIAVSVGAALLPQNNAGGDAGRAEALRLAEERLRRAKTGGDMETEADRVRARAGRSLDGFSMLDALVTAVDNKDRYTRRHSEDVMEYSLTIAREMGMDDTIRDTVAVAALIHDVGKIGIPDAVLRKPGKLTVGEFEAMKQHPQMGAMMVGVVPGLAGTLDAVRHHHERWDGGGYPFGLRGEETPLMARLMAVADAFSAMTTDRPYRKAMNRAKALSILSEGSGTQWDPKCVEAFLTTQQ